MQGTAQGKAIAALMRKPQAHLRQTTPHCWKIAAAAQGGTHQLIVLIDVTGTSVTVSSLRQQPTV
jgi:hypothetical protein